MASYPPESSPVKNQTATHGKENTPSGDSIAPMALHSSIKIDYDSDDEELQGERTSGNLNGERGNEGDSVTALLSNEGGVGASRQEKEDPQDEHGKWYNLETIKNNVKANEGFLLIASSQLFFAVINTLVKLLQQVSSPLHPRSPYRKGTTISSECPANPTWRSSAHRC